MAFQEMFTEAGGDELVLNASVCLWGQLVIIASHNIVIRCVAVKPGRTDTQKRGKASLKRKLTAFVMHPNDCHPEQTCTLNRRHANCGPGFQN